MWIDIGAEKGLRKYGMCEGWHERIWRQERVEEQKDHVRDKAGSGQEDANDLKSPC